MTYYYKYTQGQKKGAKHFLFFYFGLGVAESKSERPQSSRVGPQWWCKAMKAGSKTSNMAYHNQDDADHRPPPPASTHSGRHAAPSIGPHNTPQGLL